MIVCEDQRDDDVGRPARRRGAASEATTHDWDAPGARGGRRARVRWYSRAVQVTIDAAGRVVIPKSMRDALGLSGGRPIEIREREGVIEIEPAATPMRLEKRKGRLVSVPDRELPPLTDDLVRATLERVRR